MADALFEDELLSTLYDLLDPDRSDLEVYADLFEELGATSVLDVGCGTGCLATLLSSRGVSVVAVDPAAASLTVAQAKPGAPLVRWIHGSAQDLPPLSVDLATMTGNVAQVFVDDVEWLATLRSIHAALRPLGHLVFESRVPEDRSWLRWNRTDALAVADVPGVGIVESWPEVTEVTSATVTFTTTFHFARDGSTMTSESTLRFRTIAEMTSTLSEAGFELADVRDAPDRPGRENVFIAVRRR